MASKRNTARLNFLEYSVVAAPLHLVHSGASRVIRIVVSLLKRPAVKRV